MSGFRDSHGCWYPSSGANAVHSHFTDPTGFFYGMSPSSVPSADPADLYNSYLARGGSEDADTFESVLDKVTELGDGLKNLEDEINAQKALVHNVMEVSSKHSHEIAELQRDVKKLEEKVRANKCEETARFALDNLRSFTKGRKDGVKNYICTLTDCSHCSMGFYADKNVLHVHGLVKYVCSYHLFGNTGTCVEHASYVRTKVCHREPTHEGGLNFKISIGEDSYVVELTLHSAKHFIREVESGSLNRDHMFRMKSGETFESFKSLVEGFDPANPISVPPPSSSVSAAVTSTSTSIKKSTVVIRRQSPKEGSTPE